MNVGGGGGNSLVIDWASARKSIRTAESFSILASVVVKIVALFRKTVTSNFSLLGNKKGHNFKCTKWCSWDNWLHSNRAKLCTWCFIIIYVNVSELLLTVLSNYIKPVQASWLLPNFVRFYLCFYCLRIFYYMCYIRQNLIETDDERQKRKKNKFPLFWTGYYSFLLNGRAGHYWNRSRWLHSWPTGSKTMIRRMKGNNALLPRPS